MNRQLAISLIAVGTLILFSISTGIAFLMGYSVKYLMIATFCSGGFCGYWWFRRGWKLWRKLQPTLVDDLVDLYEVMRELVEHLMIQLEKEQAQLKSINDQWVAKVAPLHQAASYVVRDGKTSKADGNPEIVRVSRAGFRELERSLEVFQPDEVVVFQKRLARKRSA